MIKKLKNIIKTPWDSRVFGIDTYELADLSKGALKESLGLRGHFTVKVSPFSSKKLLHDYGFYYCDTLIEPYCSGRDFTYFSNKRASISRNIKLKDLIAISNGAFYGRFHRDFNIDNRLADLRYDNWLKDLYKKRQVYGLMLDKKLAGFFAFSKNKIYLHAIDKKYRGKGLAKYLWSVACRELFKKGYKEIVSSISTFNIAVLNLYSSLGFKFRKPVDVYHKMIVQNE